MQVFKILMSIVILMAVLSCGKAPESQASKESAEPSSSPSVQQTAPSQSQTLVSDAKTKQQLMTQPPPVVAPREMAAGSPPQAVPGPVPVNPMVANKPSPLLKKDVEKAEKIAISSERMMEEEARPPEPQSLPPQPPVEFNTEAYDAIVENDFLDVAQNPLSTFSIDVDTASYTNIRRFLNSRQLPPKDSVRIEEMVNYFHYDYPQPQGNVPFSVNVDMAECPWAPEHRLVRVGLKGKEIPKEQRPNCNLVFLMDVSGSMGEPNKLPLVKEALKMLVQNLTEKDSVGIVVYAGASGMVLAPTKGDQKQTIIESLDNLESGGSTNAGEGIELAYDLAIKNFIPKGINRVILTTDGDFNVGVTSRGDLLRLISEKAKSKVFLTVLGFGMGNYKDSTLEMLADKGNGNYGYIDDISEARKMLVEQIAGTLITIAKDVKIQIEFNPALVTQYRLVGYENRLLKAEEFHDDTKDAGEIGAGHTVTAFYEIVPVGVKRVETGKVDALKYQTQPQLSEAAKAGEMFTVKLRYKEPDQDTSKLLEFPIRDDKKQMQQTSSDFMFASSVVCFGMILRDSKYKGEINIDFVLELANTALQSGADQYRKEFVELVKQAKELMRK